MNLDGDHWESTATVACRDAATGEQDGRPGLHGHLRIAGIVRTYVVRRFADGLGEIYVFSDVGKQN